MKHFTLIVVLAFCYTTVFSQNCARVTSAFITNPSGDNFNYVLTANWNADGQKHINVSIYCGVIDPLNIVSTYCISISCGANCSGTNVHNFQCASLIPTATFTPFTGGCNGGTNCGPIQIYPPGGGPLPIRISSFYARRNTSGILLNWRSLSEQNAKEFIVERKTVGEFSVIGTVPALNQPTGSDYTFLDNNNSKLTSQYRLRLVDFDGGYRYSEIRAVKGFSSVSDFSIFPNPSNGSSKITISDLSEPMVVQLIDGHGRLMKTINVPTSSSVEINNLKQGFYMIKLVNKNSSESVTKKLIVTY